MKGRKGCYFSSAKSVKHCFMLDLAMILACAGDKWGVFAEMWVTSIRQDRNICFRRVKGILLENFHRSWQRRYQWLFSSWSNCDSQQRDDGRNWEVFVPAVCTKDIYLYGERAEMVVVSKEASPVRKATTNPSCTSSNLKSALSTSGMELWRRRKSHPRNFWLDGEWKWMGACRDEATFTTRYRRNQPAL